MFTVHRPLECGTMETNDQSARSVVCRVVIPIASFCLAFLFGLTSPGQLLSLKSYDAAVKSNGTKPALQTIIVYVDDYSRREIEDPLVFWHSYYAEVIHAVTRAGAKGVGVDVIFALKTDKLPPGADQQLSKAYLEAVATGTPVVMGFDRASGLPPARVYLAARSSDLVGYLDFGPDPDDFVRRFQPCGTSDQDVLIAMGIQVAARSLNEYVSCQPNSVRVGSRVFQRDENGFTLIKNLGPGYTVPHVSMVEILRMSKSGDEIRLKELFQGKLVFIGVDDTQDRHATPFYSTRRGERRTPGVEIHASIAQMVIDNTALGIVSPWAGAVVSLGFITLASFVTFRVQWNTAALLNIALIALAFGISAAVYAEGLWLATINAQVGVVAAYVGVSAYRYRTEYQAKRELRRHFAHYVSDEIIEEIIQQGKVELGGTRQKITVLFSDIRGFTTLSEKTSPEVLVRQLNEYLTAMTDVIMENGGMVDKFIGDGILALYGAPLEKRDASWRAVSSAMRMTERLAQLNARWMAEGRPTFQIGIGIHTGEAVVGNIGSPRKMDYTAVGDTVNTAARVESETKDSIQRYGVPIIITDATLRDLEEWDHQVDAEAIGIETLKGKTELTKLYILRGLTRT